MKRIISLVLAVMLLCTPAHAFDWSDIPKDLFTKEQLEAVFENAQLQEKAQQLIGSMQEIKDEIQSMSDAELEAKILELAEQYHIPDMNREQIDFLIRACRSLDTIEEIGDTVESYGEKLNAFQKTVKALTETLGSLLDTLTGLLDTLNGLLGKLQTE